MDKYDPQEQVFGGPLQMELPNATAILVLGIISIVGSFCYIIPGLVCAIISLVLASAAKRTYFAAPGRYTQASYKNMSAGKICAIIGLCLSLLIIVIAIIAFSIGITMTRSGWH